MRAVADITRGIEKVAHSVHMGDAVRRRLEPSAGRVIRSQEATLAKQHADLSKNINRGLKELKEEIRIRDLQQRTEKLKRDVAVPLQDVKKTFTKPDGTFNRAQSLEKLRAGARLLENFRGEAAKIMRPREGQEKRREMLRTLAEDKRVAEEEVVKLDVEKRAADEKVATLEAKTQAADEKVRKLEAETQAADEKAVACHRELTDAMKVDRSLQKLIQAEEKANDLNTSKAQEATKRVQEIENEWKKALANADVLTRDLKVASISFEESKSNLEMAKTEAEEITRNLRLARLNARLVGEEYRKTLSEYRKTLPPVEMPEAYKDHLRKLPSDLNDRKAMKQWRAAQPAGFDTWREKALEEMKDDDPRKGMLEALPDKEEKPGDKNSRFSRLVQYAWLYNANTTQMVAGDISGLGDTLISLLEGVNR